MVELPVLRAAAAGLAYFGVVFAAGFGLGVLRVLILMPGLGEGPAVVLELPFMLALSWVACGWLIARLDVRARLTDRLVMGGLAFATLLIAEIGVSAFAFGRSLAVHLSHYRELPALLGLVGQLAFAAFPVIRCAGGYLKKP